jgi:hypothetical protein
MSIEMSIISLKEAHNFPALITAFFLSGIFIQSALASDDEKETEDDPIHFKVGSGKRLRDDKEQIEQPPLKDARVEETSSTPELPIEVWNIIFSFVAPITHYELLNITSINQTTHNGCQGIRGIYKILASENILAAKNNLKYSIPAVEIIKAHLGQPTSFQFYDNFVEHRCHQEQIEYQNEKYYREHQTHKTAATYALDTPYIVNKQDIKALNLFFKTMNNR